MTDRDFDNIIRKSVQKYGSSYFDTSAPPHEFSAGFNRKMDALLKRKKSSARIIRIISSAAAVIALGVGVIGIYAAVKSENNDIVSQNNTAAPSPAADSIISESTDKSSSAQDNSSVSNKSFYQNDIAGVPSQNNTKSADAAEEYDSTQTYDEQIPENAAAQSPSVSSSSYITSVTRRGESIVLTDSQSETAMQYIDRLIDSGLVIPDRDCEPITEENAQYSVTVSSTGGDPITYDENGNAVTALTLCLSGSRGTVFVSDTSRVYIFSADNAERYISELEDVLDE